MRSTRAWRAPCRSRASAPTWWSPAARRIRIGATEFDLVKPCTRCVFTTVDGERGAFSEDGEPLATLKAYRRGPRGITFGQNLIARGGGVLRVGDAVEVLA